MLTVQDRGDGVSSRAAAAARRIAGRRAVALLAMAALGLALLSAGPAAAQQATVTLAPPEVILTDTPTDIPAEAPTEASGQPAALVVDGARYEATVGEDGSLTFADVVLPASEVSVGAELGGQAVPLALPGMEAAAESVTLEGLIGWLSVLPPIVAIGLALLTRRVIPSLLAGIFVGAWFYAGLSATGLWYGLLDVIDTWVLRALVPADGGTGHMSIMLFTMLIGGMVGIVYRNGGASAIVEALTGWARTRKKGEVAAAGVGTAVFFDDYSSLLVTGNAVRPITDRLRVSREKLSYIVDTTSAPIATFALVTTWIGFQVGLIGDATAGLEGYEATPYATFLGALPYMFYPILAFLFMWMVVLTGRDFGPMARAQARALDGPLSGGAAEEQGKDELTVKEGIPYRAINAWLPIAVLIVVTIAALFVTGSGETVTDIIGSADSFSALLWGSLLSVLVAGALSVGQGVLSLGETVDAWLDGVKAMFGVLVILTLAWALSDVTDALNAAGYLAHLLGEQLSPVWMPSLIFLLAAGISFATGTSWGTMGILLPLAVPLAWAVGETQGLAGADLQSLLYATTAAVLGGAIWGDHTSPISDTTVLAAATSQCGLIEHVNTQLPYGILVGAVAVGGGLIPVGFGYPWWIGMIGSLVLLYLVLLLIGRRTGEPEAAPAGGGRAVEAPAE